ncbi:DUF2795 domain-containing protein [Legionella jordanis]|uniref:DUF2795 domain-containing protein n=1 Tax=Legionella jordanis TaxID=456 RepID=A0A0W0VBX2_9GAMM|nr:DUF2795 domain-containing protein [Legionella jordanis]KTD17129.1 hypothetical protein Ljor_1435 [Legionella jordanis]RMX03257.1 DUF2795 domain-containing protein [Legionella jordanis]RMX18234.1 DUF2795 domain-containing protein [Legionella jordanis]VEH12674.1 Protein of uncharacterised function (DUF2795) [Legionella jordanis]
MSRSQDINPIEVQKYLKGINFPASKQNIIDCAKKNGAPSEVVDTIKNIKEEQFSSPTDISKHINKH